MGILAECPICHEKQSLKRKICKCGENLDRAKRAGKVKFWIKYRLPDGKQRKEAVGFSIEEARDADGKRRGQKRENRIFDILPESKITFKELRAWYEDLSPVKKLASFDRIRLALENFNKVFGDRRVNSIKLMDLEDYQVRREEEGRAAATIDMEISIAKTMVTKGFDNDLIDGRALKIFRKVKRKLRKGSNARKRIISFEEYLRILETSPSHLRQVLITVFNTGMRSGELRELRWSFIDRKSGFIRLPANVTKESKEKAIPINDNVKAVLESVTRYINHDRVFTYRGNPITHKSGMKTALKSACEKARIAYGRKNGGITFHDFRRTFKTNMLAAGVDKAHRDMILGHSMQGMDVHYLVADEKALKDAMDKFACWINTQLEAVKKPTNKKSVGSLGEHLGNT